MLQYPSISEYVSAIRDSSENLDKLTHLKPVLDNYGEPCRSVGGFAVVFKMQDEDTGKLYAIKCFHEDQVNRAAAYEEIGKVLRNNKSTYLMEVNYLPKELFVDTQMSDETEFPVLQMDWIEGETMETFITSHYRDLDAMKKLYEKFCDLALWLRTKPFAHGDIKPDNIMIKPDGNLTLVDYDGMYVPSMSGQKSPTIGTRSFSHPLRTPEDFDENIDDFALASMSLSLLAMSMKSELYNSYGALDRLLFSDSDYKDLTNSDIYKELYSLGGAFPNLLDLFSKCLFSNDKNNKTLYDQIFDIQTKGPEIISFECQEGNTVYVDDEIHFVWSINNATIININGVDVSDKVAFKYIIKKDEDFVIKATNGLKESSSHLHIKSYPKPSIKFKANKTKLRKGKDKNVRFTWNVNNCNVVFLNVNNNDYRVDLQSEKTLSFEEFADVRLKVIGIDGIRIFEKLIRINVFNESDVQFASDKLYSLPGVPVTLSWSVDHAKEVELSDVGKVCNRGHFIVTPNKSVIYKLKVTDAFGTKYHELNIQMLPLPRLKINIPTPQFENNMDVKLNVPTPNYTSLFPQIDIMGVQLNAPYAPSMDDLGIDVKLAPRIAQQINLWADIKKIYKYYRNKLLSYE